MRNNIHSRTTIEINNLRKLLKGTEVELTKYDKDSLKFLFYKKLHTNTQKIIAYLSKIRNLSTKYFGKNPDEYEWKEWVKLIDYLISESLKEFDSSIDIKLLIKENINHKIDISAMNENDHFIMEFLDRQTL